MFVHIKDCLSTNTQSSTVGWTSHRHKRWQNDAETESDTAAKTDTATVAAEDTDTDTRRGTLLMAIAIWNPRSSLNRRSAIASFGSESDTESVCRGTVPDKVRGSPFVVADYSPAATSPHSAIARSAVPGD